MAKWTSSRDITKDLDSLSEMTCGKRVKATSPIFKAVGRGRAHVNSEQQPAAKDPFDDGLNGFGHPVLYSHYCMGRGQVIEQMWKSFHKEKDQDLQNQLRAACGAGYSNSLIEESFREECSSKSDDDESQFEDAHESGDSSVEGEETKKSSNAIGNRTSTSSEKEAGIGNTLAAVSESTCETNLPASAEDSNTSSPNKPPQVIKRKPRKITNVLIDNLLKKKNEESVLSTSNLNPEAEPFNGFSMANDIPSNLSEEPDLNPNAQPFECGTIDMFSPSLTDNTPCGTIDMFSPSLTDNTPLLVQQAFNTPLLVQQAFNTPLLVQQAFNTPSPVQQSCKSRVKKVRKLDIDFKVHSHTPLNTFGYQSLITYDNRPVHRANNFNVPHIEAIPVHTFSYRSEEFPPLS